MLSSERLLYRLFHERGVKVFAPQEVRDSCRCSRDGISAMLRRFSPQERRDMIGDNGKIGGHLRILLGLPGIRPEGFDEA